MKTDGIIFDMDGTIWDTCVEVARTWSEEMARIGVNKTFTVEVIRSCMGMLMEDFAAKAMPEIDADKRIPYLKQCCAYENEYLAEHGGNLFRGVTQTLEKLSEKYPLFIVSNCQAGYIEAFFQGHHTEKYFKDYENPGRTGLDKAGNIRLIAQRNHLKAPVYVGDTSGDMEACKKAGVPFIYAAYGFGEVDAGDYDAKIDSFDQLCDLFIK